MMKVGEMHAKLLRVFKKYGVLFPLYYFIHKCDHTIARIYRKKLTNHTLYVNNNFKLNALKHSPSLDFIEKTIISNYYELAYNLTDPKCRWERNRLQKYLSEIVHNQDDHPTVAKRVINRIKNDDTYSETNAMEISIRLINILLLFNNSSAFLPYSLLIEKECKNNVAYILNNLECGIKYSSNHYFFNLIGIIIYLQSIKTKGIFDKLINWYYDNKLGYYLKKSINKDGSFFEGSTHYHKYVHQSLLLLCCLRPDLVDTRIGRQLQLLDSFTSFIKLGNTYVSIGDNDSGYVIRRSYITQIKNYNYVFDALKLGKLSVTRRNKISKLNKNSSKSFGLLHLKNAKWEAFMRHDNSVKNHYRKVIGKHCHNDQQHILLSCFGIPVIVSKGTYSYLPYHQFRYKTISGSTHNGVYIRGFEQGRINMDWNEIEHKITSNILNDSHDCLSTIVTYRKISCIRTIKYDLEQFMITDKVSSSDEHNGISSQCLFILNPLISINKSNERNIQLSYNKLKIQVSINSDHWRLVDTKIYNEYSHIQSSRGILLVQTINNSIAEFSINFKIC